MTTSSRSAFESAVFHSSELVGTTPKARTAEGIYGNIVVLNPSSHAVARAGEEQAVLDGNNRVTRFDEKYLFEIIVMYLFNGVRPTEGGVNGGLELLHYFAYIIPEADKLHVVDMRAGNKHRERMEYVRVVFDTTDFRFRVLTRKKEKTGWVDISSFLRSTFTTKVHNMVANQDLNLEDEWAHLAGAMHDILANMLPKYTGLQLPEVTAWLPAKKDLRWERPLYGDVETEAPQNLFKNLKMHFERRPVQRHRDTEARGEESGTVADSKADAATSGVKRHPFIASYWADNYMEMDSYKVARMFNGLVGYGQYLYGNDNNYAKRSHGTNFYLPLKDPAHAEVKKWLWHDVYDPEAEAKVVVQDDQAVARAPPREYATSTDRGAVLEAELLDKGILRVTEGFKNIVERRHVATTATSVADMHSALGLQGGTSSDDAGQSKITSFFMEFDPFLLEPFPQLQTAGGAYRQPDEDRLKGHLGEYFMADAIRALAAVIHGTVAAPYAHEHAETISTTSNRVLKAMIHLRREQWLMKRHTTTMEETELKSIMQSYATPFWHSKNPPTGEEARDTDKAKLVKVNNNSSLRWPYRDRAVEVYETGYGQAWRLAGEPVDSLACRMAVSVVEDYFDRKKDNNAQLEYIAKVDLTSLLRTSYSVVKTFDTFIIAFSEESDRIHRSGLPATWTIQSTRTMFASHGSYFVLRAGMNLFSNMYGTIGGRRRLDADDVCTFAYALGLVVDNPGVWNMVNGETTHIANSGFAHNGTLVDDGQEKIRFYNHTTQNWSAIADMTYRRLRVGVMREAQTSASAYMHGTMDNTRRVGAETAGHMFVSFMRGVYNSEEYRATISDPFNEERAVYLQKKIEANATMLVDRLYVSYRDAGLQVDQPGAEAYAFPNLLKLKIEFPSALAPLSTQVLARPAARHRNVFYMLFGETIAALATDLKDAVPITDLKPQHLQVAAFQKVATRYATRLSSFLTNLTDAFFAGALHKNLNANVKARFASDPDTPGDAFSPRAREEPHEDTAKYLLRNIDALVLDTRHHTAQGKHLVYMVGWPGEDYVESSEVMRVAVNTMREFHKDPSSTEEEHEAAETEDDEAAETVDDEAAEPENAKRVFIPYLDVLRQVAACYHASVDAPFDPLASQRVSFFENRMLAMRVCEEQMHLIKKNSKYKAHYVSSTAWSLLFDTFLYYRQCISEFTPPRR
jgi:hypothetical protein